MVIKVQIRTVYGVDQIYPACSKAVLFAQIAGTKTLTADTLRKIAALGYEIEQETAKLLAKGSQS